MKTHTTTLLTFAALATSLLLAGCGQQSKPAPAAAAATPPPAPPPPTLYDAEAFFATTSYIMPAGYAWSADDKQLLVSSDETGIFNLYAMPAAGEGKQPLTSSTADSTFAVSWFPGDGRALFTADRGGNEINHLYVREADGKHARPDAGRQSQSRVPWLVRRQAALLRHDERAQRASVRPVPLRHEGLQTHARYSGTMRPGRSPRFRPTAATWRSSSPAPAPTPTSTSSISRAKQHTPQLITKHEGNVTHDVYSFTRDGKQLVYATDEFGEFNQAWTYDLAAGTRTPLIRADWDISFVAFSESGRYRIWGVNEDARTVVHILDCHQRQGNHAAGSTGR